MAGNCLEVAVADAPTRTERFGRLPGLLRIHTLILNRNERLGFLEFTNAHLRVRMQGMPARVRSVGLWFAKGRMPEVRQQATGPEALRICGFSTRDCGEIPFHDPKLRRLWRPARSGRLLDELAGN
jgi:hypothetical protein